jgi:hypothetical protein
VVGAFLVGFSLWWRFAPRPGGGPSSEGEASPVVAGGALLWVPTTLPAGRRALATAARTYAHLAPHHGPAWPTYGLRDAAMAAGLFGAAPLWRGGHLFATHTAGARPARRRPVPAAVSVVGGWVSGGGSDAGAADGGSGGGASGCGGGGGRGYGGGGGGG